MFQGTKPVNALVTAIDVPADKDGGKYKIHYSRYAEGSKKGIKEDDEFDLIIGSDGANSRVAKVNLPQTPSSSSPGEVINNPLPSQLRHDKKNEKPQG